MQASLSPEEEEVAYANYLRRRQQALQSQVARCVLLSNEQAALLEELNRVVPPEGARVALAYPEFSTDLLPAAALRERWERMAMAVRAAFLAEEDRSRPRIGDQLLAVDGKRVPRGQWDQARGAFDHSETYSMLEQCGGGTTTAFSRGDENKKVRILGNRVRVTAKGAGMAGRWRDVRWDEHVLQEEKAITGEIIAVEEWPGGAVTITTARRTLNLPNPRLVLRTDEIDGEDDLEASGLFGGGQVIGADGPLVMPAGDPLMAPDGLLSTD